jgi:aminobenzoyl-glutamate utilization protein B
MARAGAFSDLDVCLDWHPYSKNLVSLNTSNALNNFAVMFYGKTSHAAGDPWNGRSALDGIELLNIGINYLREHVKPTVRIHYVIPEGGRAPNIVPDYAEGWYYVRGKTRKEVEEVYKRVLKIIQGAALMSETESKVRVFTGVYNYLKNRVVAEMLYKNLRLVGPPDFSKEDQVYAKKMQKSVGKKEEGMSTRIEPFMEAKNYWGGGSTDAADVSWIVPTASFTVACWPLNVPGHSWCVTSASGSSTGFKGMKTASKVLALTALEIILRPSIIKKAKKEFLKKTGGAKYKSPLGKDQKPRIVK